MLTPLPVVLPVLPPITSFTTAAKYGVGLGLDHSAADSNAHVCPAAILDSAKCATSASVPLGAPALAANGRAANGPGVTHSARTPRGSDYPPVVPTSVPPSVPVPVTPPPSLPVAAVPEPSAWLMLGVGLGLPILRSSCGFRATLLRQLKRDHG